MHDGLGGGRHHLGRDPVRGAVLRAGHGGLADGAAARPREGLAPGVAHVGPLASHVGLVHFDRAGERVALAVVLVRKRLADAVRQEPGRLLGDVQVAVQLHAALALQRRGEQVDRQYPGAVAEGRALQGGPHPHAEPLAARTHPAAPRHRLVVVAAHLGGPALWAPR